MRSETFAPQQVYLNLQLKIAVDIDSNSNILYTDIFFVICLKNRFKAFLGRYNTQ